MEVCLAVFDKATRHTIKCTELSQSPRGIETDEHVAEVVPYLEQKVLGSTADAFVLSCFSDPGIGRIRALTARPVIGIAEAAYLAALGLGRRFGIISLGPSSIARHFRYLKELGLDSRLAGDRSIDMTVVELMAGDVVENVSRTGEIMRDVDGADVLILGCAGLGSYREGLQERLRVPVVDPVQAGVGLACTTLDLGYRKNAS